MTHTFPAMRTVLPVVVAVPSGCVGIEELHHHWSQNLRSYLVGLTWKAAMLGMGHRLDQRQRRELGRPPTRYQWLGPFSSAPHRTDRTTFAVASSPVMHIESFHGGCPACIFL